MDSVSLLVHKSAKKNGLDMIIESLKTHQHRKSDHQEEEPPSANQDKSPSPKAFPVDKYGENSTEAALPQATKLAKKRRMEHHRPLANSNGPTTLDYSINNNNNNNNNNVKNERLSPGTPDVSSRSRSVTPSSSSYPNTPPATDPSLPPVSGRNYSDFMRSLAAKYNHANPNDTRNGFPPPLDPRFKSHFSTLLPNLPKDSESPKKSDFSSILNPFANPAMFPPLIDMSSTQALLALVRTAKENELQSLLKNVKRQDAATSPLDLSAAAPPPPKRARFTPKSTNSASRSPSLGPKRSESESPRLHEDVSHWSVDDVGNFISSIDICAEYAQNFREQRIDGSGLPLLTEEHLTTTMSMKLGPALKLRSILAKKLGSCSVCLHCTHCHTSGSPEPSNTAGNTSDSGGTS